MINHNILISLDKLCKSTFSHDKLKEILNEISDNFESYENQKFKLVTLKYRICNHISINEKISVVAEKNPERAEEICFRAFNS